MRKIKKIILVFLGTLFLIIGVIGIALPLLPTTPFLLLSAACYVNSSEKCYHWLLNNKWLGKYIKNYREKKAIPKSTKIVALFFLWATISFSILFAADHLLMKFGLLVIAIGVTIHLVTMKTLSEDPTEHDNKEKENSLDSE